MLGIEILTVNADLHARIAVARLCLRELVNHWTTVMGADCVICKAQVVGCLSAVMGYRGEACGI